MPSKLSCDTVTKFIKNFTLLSGDIVNLDVEFYFEAGDQGFLSGPYDQAVEPREDYIEIQKINSNGSIIYLSPEEEEEVILEIQQGV